jgi:hypothetical protein
VTLLEKQQLFVHCLAKLIFFTYDRGFKLTMGRGAVSSAANVADGGHRRSTHLFGLAMDLNLFDDLDNDGKDDDWCKSSEAHAPLGAFWESLHPLCCWGGRWGDGNHYSITHEGVK